MRVNVRAVHLCYKHAAKAMIKQGTGGKLIAASSVAGYRGSKFLSPYAASKVSAFKEVEKLFSWYLPASALPLRGRIVCRSRV